MAVYDLNPLADDNVSEYGKEGEDGWKGGLAVDDEKGDVVDLEAIRKVPDTCAASVGMRDDDHLVAAVDELLSVVRTRIWRVGD
jgi:hypothetical protein